ncbi:MAG: glycoside hydrolase family 3 protein [Desulfobacteraceae bacterium]|nr:glycoside hydrolase family 3 protein [Desulfobacteraceae bacterium]
MKKQNPGYRELSGQRVMAGFEGTTFNKDVEHLICELKIGGLILFAGNIDSPDQTRKLCDRAQACARAEGLPPLFIAVDQEGGVVARLKEPWFTAFPGNPSIKSRREAETFARTTAAELKGVGINMNLAPVMDIAPEGFDSIMESRAFPGGPDRVAKLGARVIETLQDNGIMACAKHFPGIGRTRLDSHFELPVLDEDPAILEVSDLVPFVAAAKSEVSAMMLSHILYPRLDPDWPASLSPEIAGNLLRKRVGFQGVVMTDDLDMKAIKQDIKTCVTQILRSQIDITLVCHKGPDIETAVLEIEKQIASDENLHRMTLESMERIQALKTKYLQ